MNWVLWAFQHHTTLGICDEPAVVLAPMGVSNIVFRRLIRSIGGCGLTATEFIASKAISAQSKALLMADFDQDEHPIAVQIFGRDLKKWRKHALWELELNIGH